MKFYSYDFVDDDILPEEFTCQGVGLVPSFLWEGIPYETKSLAIIVEDLDVNFFHWGVYNIPATEESYYPGVTNGIEIKNSSGEFGYYPPCPPMNEVHEYEFTIYALDSFLPSDIEEPEALRAYINDHKIDSEIISVYV